MGHFCSKTFAYDDSPNSRSILSPYATSIYPLLKEKRGSTTIITDNSDIKTLSISLKDFVLLKQLGSGASGKIYLVKKLTSGKLYALKAIKKLEISKRNHQEYTWNERQILQKNESPYIASLKYSFQNEDYLFLVLEFLKGGDLFFHINKEIRFSEEKTKFYAAELILALEYLHMNSYVYRDLKPENVLFDENGHIKLVDFGLSKRLEGDMLCESLLGTPEYVAPEILLGKKYDCSVDFWNLGCMIYEMITGIPPFFDKDIKVIFKNIIEKDIDFPENLEISSNCKELIGGLLEKDMKKRMKNIDIIKKHRFFQGIDWELMKTREVKAPFIPEIDGEIDLKYFERKYVDMPIEGIWEEATEDTQNLYDYYLDFSYRRRLESVVDR